MAEIRIENLTKEFGSLVAVRDLDLTVADGSFIALLGPSGCGKTTTMNVISGLETPTRGEIYFDGQPVSRIEPGRRNVGFVFQNYAIFTHMRVYDNLAFGLRVRKPKPPKEENATPGATPNGNSPGSVIRCRTGNGLPRGRPSRSFSRRSTGTRRLGAGPGAETAPLCPVRAQ